MASDAVHASRRAWALDAVLGLALVALLTFAPVSYLLAGRLPEQPREPAVAAPPGPHGPGLRPLPAGLSAGLTVDDPSDLRGMANQALGPAGGRALIALLDGQANPLRETAVGGRPGYAPYPYRYPAMTALLDAAPGEARTPAAAALGAALLSLASRPSLEAWAGAMFENASPAAFAVLDRARAGGDCTAQLNLVLLLAADVLPRDEPVRAESRRAESTCPGDPTSGWLLVQYESQRSTGEITDENGDPLPADAAARALASATRLADKFPNSAAAVAALGDVHLRTGLELSEEGRPFAARNELRAAEAEYRRVRAMGDPEGATGQARALVGLGEPARAADVLRATTARGNAPGPVLEVLILAEESAHRFAAAETAARGLAARGGAAYPAGPALFPVPSGDEGGPDAEGREPEGPMSHGTSGSARFTVSLQPAPGGAGATVEDLSFIPVFRPDTLTALQPSCAEASWRRDAVLAGHAQEALSGLPNVEHPEFSDIRPTRAGDSCTLSGSDLRDVARLEVGLPLAGDAAERDVAADKRQNLWRWAGDLGRAEGVARAWARGAPFDAPLPFRRLGEVQFLRHQYNDAAESFSTAARRARWDVDEAIGVPEAALARGASLVAAGRRAEGELLLLDVVAATEYGAAYWLDQENTEGLLRWGGVAYHAHAQVAELAREEERTRAAVEHYGAARELLRVFEEKGDRFSGLRQESLLGNAATADLALGRLDEARRSVEAALRIDPGNPAFLMTAGYVAALAGRTDEAIDHYNAALRSDLGAFPAANDLGVVLARQHRNGPALNALRRAVGARLDYALGWFNLGVVLRRSGPMHVLDAQGAFSRAFRLDPRLRDAPREPTLDPRIYRTGLDLSRPLPARWSFSDLQGLAPAPSAGLLAVVLLGIGLARAGGGAGRDVAQAWFDAATERIERLRAPGWLRRPVWGVLATAVILIVPILVHRGLDELVPVALGALLLGLVAMRVRAVVARWSSVAITQRTWLPSLVLGLAAAPLAPWAPLPVIALERPAPRVSAAAPLSLAVVSLVLFLQTAAFALPLLHTLASAALVMAASLLLPVGPLDGAALRARDLAAGAGLVGAAVLLSLSLPS